MKGIILAAGRGRRMGSLTNSLPKCRTIFKGKELIQWQIQSLRDAGINEIAIVRGYLAETFDFKMKYFDNNRWLETNMVVSLISANEWLKTDSCISSYSDIIYSSDAVKRLMNSSGDITITYDPNWKKLWELRFDDPLIDAETFRIDKDLVIEIGNRATSKDQIEGQFMGLVKYTRKGWKIIIDYLSNFNQNEIDKMDITKLLMGLISSGINVNAVPIIDEWYEIDSESDLSIYNSTNTTSI